MHPLDRVSLDGFDMVATAESVLRHRFDDVWRLLAVTDDEPLTLPPAASHRVIERFGPGEHRCSTVRSAHGREVCSRGFRRITHHEVLEFQGRSGEDQLIRVTYSPLVLGRTRMTSFAGVRPGTQPDAHRAVVRTTAQRWDAILERRHARAARFLHVYC